MRSTACAVLAAACFVGLAGAPSRAQATDDEQTRTTFLVTREQPAPSKGRSGRRASSPKSAKASPLGVAYSILTRQVDGTAIRVDPRGPFHAGDALRLVVEPNTDGYVYVFNESESGPAEMIFPDPRIDGGRNRVVAHSLVEIPSSREANEKYRWFYFYDGRTVERLFVVVSRVPLPGVPTGTALTKYCDAYRESCPWQPPQAIWQSVLEASRLPRHSAVGGVFGLAQTRGEQEAATRKIGLARDEPEPSMIHIGTSRDASAIVVAFELATE